MSELNDIVNAIFEFGAILGIYGHIRQIKKDKKVNGIYIPTIMFFTLWGFWNIYYYPSLGQWFSFIAGSVLALMNCAYVYLLVKYSRRK